MTTPFLSDYLKIVAETIDVPADPTSDPGTSPEMIAFCFDAETGELSFWDPVNEERVMVGGGGASDAEDVAYDNASSGLAATDVQAAIDELDATIDALGTPPASTTDLPEGSNLYYTDERAQDAVGAMVDTTLNYVDGTPLLQRAALTGAITVAAGSNTSVIGTIPGRLIGVQTITATGAGTYTPTAGTTSIIIEMVGGGGGGSGVAQAAAAQINLGGGGGGGAYLRKRLTANFSGAAYVVGAKGTGGTAGNNSGTDGTATTFTDTAGSPTVYTAGGGKNGDPRTSFAPPISLSPVVGGSGEGGTATNGDLNVGGGLAQIGFATSTVIGWSSAGGDSIFGRGGPGVTNGAGAGTDGSAATGKGGGGSGAYSSNNAGGAKAGGDGTDGILIIWEFA